MNAPEKFDDFFRRLHQAAEGGIDVLEKPPAEYGKSNEGSQMLDDIPAANAEEVRRGRSSLPPSDRE